MKKKITIVKIIPFFLSFVFISFLYAFSVNAVFYPQCAGLDNQHSICTPDPNTDSNAPPHDGHVWSVIQSAACPGLCYARDDSCPLLYSSQHGSCATGQNTCSGTQVEAPDFAGCSRANNTGRCCMDTTFTPAPTTAPLPTGAGTVKNPCPSNICNTAVGTIDVSSGGPFVTRLFQVLLGLSGGIALLIIILAGYNMVISQGNPEKIKRAQETLTAAIIGLLFIILSVVILQIIGVDILVLPGFGR